MDGHLYIVSKYTSVSQAFFLQDPMFYLTLSWLCSLCCVALDGCVSLFWFSCQFQSHSCSFRANMATNDINKSLMRHAQTVFSCQAWFLHK